MSNKDNQVGLKFRSQNILQIELGAVNTAIQNRLILTDKSQLSTSLCSNISKDVKQKIGRVMDSDDYYYQQDYP